MLPASVPTLRATPSVPRLPAGSLSAAGQSAHRKLAPLAAPAARATGLHVPTVPQSSGPAQAFSPLAILAEYLGVEASYTAVAAALGVTTTLLTTAVVGLALGAVWWNRAQIRDYLLARLRRAPAPILAALPRPADDEEGYCGNFQRIRGWQVANPVQGFIVQEITRTFNVTLGRLGAPLAGGALNAYVRDPASSVHSLETHYWELWQVQADGTISDGGEDTFGLCSIIPWDGQGRLNVRRDVQHTTVGRFVMTGSARFYPTAAAVPAIFRRNAVQAAGGLFSTANNPTAHLPASAPGVVNYTVTAAWDSWSPSCYSVVT